MLNAELVYKALHEKNSVQRRFARATFEIWQRFGFHVVGDHFYDPVPNTHTIKETYISGARELPAISIDWQSLVPDASALMSTYIEEYLHDRAAFQYVEGNALFNGIDALYYYSFLRRHKPRRVVEIGQGFSTRIALAALARNAVTEPDAPELVSIDPYSRVTLKAPEGLRYSIVRKSLQDVEKEIPAMLVGGDLLFVDSSHVFKFGSDVQLLFERIYPRLAAGVSLHIHDIFTPFDYPVDWMVKENRFWNEQYFLENFLSYNRDFRVQAPIHFIARDGSVDRMLWERNVGPGIVRREGTSLYAVRSTSA